MSQRLSGYMVTALDMATATVLKSISIGEWHNVPIHLLVLAYTTGDDEINDYVEKELESLENQKKVVTAGVGYSYANYALNAKTSEIQILKVRSLQMYKQVRRMQRSKGYLDAGGQIGHKEFEDLARDSAPEGF